MSGNERTARPAFLQRDPVELRFGTSGLRGLVSDMTDLEVAVNTAGFLEFLAAGGSFEAGTIVPVAGDLRPSSERILAAVCHAVLAGGGTPEYLGTLPTPALTLHGLRHEQPSIMVTGSHIPADRNGIKFNRGDGEVLKSDEAGILAAVGQVRRRQYACTAADSPFDAHGMLKAPPPLPPVDPAGRAGYLRRYTDAFPADLLGNCHVVVYQHSAVGRELLVELLEQLGARVTAVGKTDEFMPFDTENVDDDQAVRHRAWLESAGGADLLVSTDGDGDRPLVVDEHGDMLAGDVLGAVVARALGADFAALPISCSDAVDSFLDPAGIELRKTRIGSPWVIAAMHEALAAGHRRVVGWEANGGFMTASSFPGPAGTLGPLPTRDALLPIVMLLATIRAADEPLSSWRRRLPHRASRAGLIDEFPADAARAVVAAVSPAPQLGIVEVVFDGDDVTAHSDGIGTPAATAAATASARRCRERLAEVFDDGSGFGAITGINYVDGVRVRFDNGDVAHIRPSGNAPQLRIYAISDTAARAAQIVRLGIAEPDGLLRRLQRLHADG